MEDTIAYASCAHQYISHLKSCSDDTKAASLVSCGCMHQMVNLCSLQQLTLPPCVLLTRHLLISVRPHRLPFLSSLN